ncbi:MAG: metallophosphoesterase [Deltaproteobacteria bacterium]|nr:metallophosphoesterase [Deltaproteobacteria bacterium]
MPFSASIVHLSDLHFGEGSRFKERDPKVLGVQLKTTIESALKLRFGISRPNLIITTGDLTQRAASNEFEAARLFFTSLKSALGIAASRFVFLPGNHDVSWDECKAYFDADGDKRSLSFDPELNDKKLAEFDRFKKEFYGSDEPKSEKLERGAVLYKFEDSGGANICVVALNSCEQETDEKHEGIISKDQAQPVMDRLYQGADLKGFVKIIALHHPVNASSDGIARYLENLKKEPNLTPQLLARFESDALSVKGNEFINMIMADCHCHMLLHGHQHSFDEPHPWKWKQDSNGHCQICPAGSFGIKPDELLEDQPSCLNVIHLFEKNVRLNMRKIFLEYDPVERLPGTLDTGCFRDTGREAFTATFPLTDACRDDVRTADSHSEKNFGKKSFDKWIHDRIESLLVANSDFCRCLAVCLDAPNAAGPLTDELVQRRFSGVSSEINGDYAEDVRAYSTQLKEVLFLLAQAECKPELVEQVRETLKKGEPLNSFQLKTRYIDLAELVITAALQQKVQIQKGSGASPLAANRMINLCNLDQREPGFNSDNLRVEALSHLMDRLKISKDVKTTDAARRIDFYQSLEAYFLTKKPFAIAHFCVQPLEIPFIIEFIVPDKTDEKDMITQCGDALLFQLISIMLDEFDSGNKRGA